MNINNTSNNLSSEAIRLSRGFKTTVYEKEMPKGELIGKSIVAAALGIVPFLINQIAMYAFKGFAYLGAALQKAENSNHSLKQKAALAARILTGIPGVCSAAAMIGTAKLFALSQTITWKHYVKHPSGDGTNTRLAWYGSQSWLVSDLKAISKTFFQCAPQSPNTRCWTLSDWSRLKV